MVFLLLVVLAIGISGDLFGSDLYRRNVRGERITDVFDIETNLIIKQNQGDNNKKDIKERLEKALGENNRFRKFIGDDVADKILNDDKKLTNTINNFQKNMDSLNRMNENNPCFQRIKELEKRSFLEAELNQFFLISDEPKVDYNGIIDEQERKIKILFSKKKKNRNDLEAIRQKIQKKERGLDDFFITTDLTPKVEDDKVVLGFKLNFIEKDKNKIVPYSFYENINRKIRELSNVNQHQEEESKNQNVLDFLKKTIEKINFNSKNLTSLDRDRSFKKRMRGIWYPEIKLFKPGKDFKRYVEDNKKINSRGIFVAKIFGAIRNRNMPFPVSKFSSIVEIDQDYVFWKGSLKKEIVLYSFYEKINQKIRELTNARQNENDHDSQNENNV